MKILVLNSGSSSQKCRLYQVAPGAPLDPPPALWRAEIEWGLAQEPASLRIENSRGERIEERIDATTRAAAVERMLRGLWEGAAPAVRAPSEIQAVGHRIVHGGAEFRAPARIDARVLQAIAHHAEIAPLHNRAEIEGVRLVEKHLGSVPQVAVFDTAFHRTLPRSAAVYPGPYAWLDEGIERYGFHGINHRYCAERAARMLGKTPAEFRVITCHLGNGCSLAAVSGGHSVDTTMGFTPLEGLMMGTRSGSVDPGILIHLARKHRYTPDDLDRILNRESGLLGLSGVSSDLREVLAAARQGHSRAGLAFDVFLHRLRAGIGWMLASLGGLDALVFTAGIGENSPDVRAGACEPFAFLGLRLDPAKNADPAGDADVAAGDSSVRVLVIRAQEDWAIARECRQLLDSAQGKPPGRE